MTSVGFFGLPGSGKSTVFHALTHQALTPQFLGYDLKPHQAVVKVPDARFEEFARRIKARQVVHATMEFVDIPGFDPAGTETRLKNAVLEHYRLCDALALVVNLFDRDEAGQAAKGMRLLLDELVLLGLVTLEGILPRLAKAATVKSDHESQARYELLNRVKDSLEQGIPVRRMSFSAEDQKRLREYAFISAKPVVAVLNVADSDLAESDASIPGLSEVLTLCQAEGVDNGRFSAALEAGLADLSEAEAAEYMAEFGIAEPVLPRFIRAAYGLLGLITYFTGSEKEARSWSLRQGSNAQEAAGVIHSDMARGFIRAETIGYSEFIAAGGMQEAKAQGKLRLEGKDYIVHDGDILNIRFNV